MRPSAGRRYRCAARPDKFSETPGARPGSSRRNSRWDRRSRQKTRPASRAFSPRPAGYPRRATSPAPENPGAAGIPRRTSRCRFRASARPPPAGAFPPRRAAKGAGSDSWARGPQVPIPSSVPWRNLRVSLCLFLFSGMLQRRASTIIIYSYKNSLFFRRCIFLPQQI